MVRSATYKVPNHIRSYIGFIVAQPYARCGTTIGPMYVC
jgi:hypothetical protein